MNSKKRTVLALLALVVLAFIFGVNTYLQRVQNAQQEKLKQGESRLERAHTSVLGPQNAPVTIVEFFDPACETCRAFYPVVKALMARYPNDVRLVVRYAPFHQGSDQVVKFLEAAKQQDRYWQVLEAVLAAQPAWAAHGQPNIALAYQAGATTGLDVQRALADAQSPDVVAALQQDIEDLTALDVTKTPTFFVNGRSLPSFGAEQLAALVAEEVAKARQ